MRVWEDSMPGDEAGILHGQMQAQGHSVLGVRWNGGEEAWVPGDTTELLQQSLAVYTQTSELCEIAKQLFDLNYSYAGFYNLQPKALPAPRAVLGFVKDTQAYKPSILEVMVKAGKLDICPCVQCP